MPRDLAGLGAIAAIECRLAAAGLVFGEIDPVAEAFENVGHRHAHLGEELVDHAGDEQRDLATHHQSLNLIRYEDSPKERGSV